jgi:hypothetical protein
MRRILRLSLPLLLLTGLAACHTDPFGVKPEVRGVEIPDKPAEPAAEDKTEPAPAPKS